MEGIGRAIGGVLKRGFDLLLPPLCLSCGAIVAEPGSLCPECWGKVTFFHPPFCACCGLPFEIDAGPRALCANCAAGAPPFRRARAVFRYDEASRSLVLRFKHADRLEGAPAFARWMARAGAELIETADLIAPVPLHRLRLLSRRYNQAAVLALALGRVSGKPVEPALVERRRATPAMGHLGRRDRALNVKGAFQVPDRNRRRVEGRTVLLIDDVLTTGATVGECAQALSRAGAVAVDVLTLGRVVR